MQAIKKMDKCWTKILGSLSSWLENPWCVILPRSLYSAARPPTYLEIEFHRISHITAILTSVTMRLSLVALEISVESSKLRSANSLSFCPKPTVAAQRRSGKAHAWSVKLPNEPDTIRVIRGPSWEVLILVLVRREIRNLPWQHRWVGLLDGVCGVEPLDETG